MKKNMGGADRILRIAIAIVIAILFWQGLISGILGYLLLGLAAIFLLTSLISICPLYTLFRIRTCRR
ncbi:YgaP family membrane protein [Altibacter sp. HG106]|uniref:YgaP family membrane protein n=1 Tax=Altibacter sp. HG106 TaxID=3023937 RepID=UPI002350C0BD|nr:DUF2892 domain-containing protein [Altibacter sp. HG106]MDC7995496.1 DUF2892 domain-containing protein [Altibacter sp. HG106]